MSLKRKLLVMLLIVVALGLLYPGITQPVLTLTGTVEKSKIAELGIEMIAGEGADAQTRQMLTAISSFLGFDQIEGQLQAYNNTRSVWGTVEELSRSGNLPVAFLIVFFSLVIPVFKLLVQSGSLFVEQAGLRNALLTANAALSKWSMSDVFVMGLLVAFMAGSASGQMGDMLTMYATLEPGFYYFLAYCLFSIAAGIVMRGPVAAKVQA
jgi:hypothetical protein